MARLTISILIPSIFFFFFFCTLSHCAAVPDHCSARTNTTHQTLPAFIYVRNTCASATIYTCLEYEGAFQYMRSVPPGQSTFIASQVHDCWTFRARSCNGKELYQHSLIGSRKFTIGCTIDDIDIQKIGIEHDVRLSCTLTTVPTLQSVISALQQHEQAHEFKFSGALKEQKVIQYVDRVQLLKFTLTKAVDLARHGIPVNQSVSLYEHSRALVQHIKQCASNLVKDNEYAIPSPYLVVYGIVSGAIEAKARAEKTWISKVSALTPHQKEVLKELQDLVDGNSITDRNPLFANAAKTNELLQTTTKSLNTVKQSQVERSTSDYAEECNRRTPVGQEGEWVHYAKPSVPFKVTQCCSLHCLSAEEIFSTGTLSATTLSCCAMCNLERCSTASEAALKGAIRSIAILFDYPESTSDGPKNEYFTI